MNNFRFWFESVQLHEGDKIVIFNDGDFQIGDYDLHAEMPGYDEAKYVFHGFIFPSKKQLIITDFYVPGSGPGSNRSKEAIKFYSFVRKNLAPTIEPGIKKMIRERVISSQWTIKSIWNGQFFKVSEIDKQKSLSTQQAVDAEKKFVADREGEGQKLGAAYNQKDPKVLLKNKESNPSAWFKRYEESTATGNEKHSWLSPEGKFYPVPEGFTHSDSIPSRFWNLEHAFENKWHRVTYTGNQLITFNPFQPLTFSQRNSLKDIAIKYNMSKVVYDNDEEEKIIWSNKEIDDRNSHKYQPNQKSLFKNKEQNPEKWFYRYQESFSTWLESNSNIKWQDFEENSLEGPKEGEDCVAVLSDGSKVIFDFKYDYVKITYNRKSPQNEIGDAIESFAKINPDEKLDGMYLDKYLDFYKEIKPNIYQRFEPQPGDKIGEIDIYEPEEQPDLSNYMIRKSQASYPNGPLNQITPATGYVLPDGRTVTMGKATRDDDHRFMIPNSKSLDKWGWPKLDTETEKMYELMRRSGAVRIMVSDPFIINLTKPMTKAQKQIIRNYIETKNIKEILVSFVGGREYQFTTKDHRQMDRYLG